MKTTDLIPILLYQLKDGDKYGLELVESIKSASAGQLEIKQPTLYPLLKKLEKSKFISSYWQDSEIGGKRHYYKITENGLLQLDTYPPIEDLLKNALDDDDSVELHEEVEKIEENLSTKSPSPFDNIFADAFGENTSQNAELDNNNNTQDIETDNNIDTQNVVFELADKQTDNTIEKDTDASSNLIEEASTDEVYASADLTSEIGENNTYSNVDTESEAVENEAYSNVELTTEIDDNIYSNDSLASETVENTYASAEFVSETDEKVDTLPDDTAKIETEQKPSSPANFDIFDVLPYGENEEKKEEVETSNFVLNNPFFESEKKEIVEKPIEQPLPSFETDKPKNLFVSAPTTTKPKLNTVSNETEYRDYIDYKNDPKIVRSKKIAKMKLLQLSATSLVGLILLFTLLAVCIKNKTTPLFVTVFIAYTLYIVFRFVKFVGDYKMLRLRIDVQNIEYNFKKQILIRAILFGVIVLALLVANLVGLKNGKLFSINNFGNFLAPIVLSLMLFVDYLFSYLFFKVFYK